MIVAVCKRDSTQQLFVRVSCLDTQAVICSAHEQKNKVALQLEPAIVRIDG